MGSVLVEALIVVAVGLCVALGANGLRADGLQLDRDYFPTSIETPTASDDQPAGTAVTVGLTPFDEQPIEPLALDAPAQETAPVDVTPAHAESDSPPGADVDGLEPEVVARLAAKGLVAVGHAATVELWRDPMFQEYEATLFLDARREEQYAEGHIPGARHFDPFYPERFLDTLMPVLASSMMVVVYCAGGECDDSESAALFLLNIGAVQPGQLSIYAGGMHAWTDAQLPVELGERGSGEMLDQGEPGPPR
jgi:rhodanese-related sulfurtransferase